MDEIWKPVRGFEGYYEVSNLGRLRRIARTAQNKQPTGVIASRRNGYYVQALLSVNAVQSRLMIHRLVYETFVGPIPRGLQINHINGLKHDNRLENLEVVTASQNIRHSYHVLKNEALPGSKHHKAKVHELDVVVIRTLRKLGAPRRDIAREYQLSYAEIGNILSGRNWKHVPRRLAVGVGQDVIPRTTAA